MSLLLAARRSTNYTAVLNAGAYTIAGQSLTVSFGRKVALNAGAYAYTGKALTVSFKRNAALGPGSYVYTGQSLQANYIGGILHNTELPHYRRNREQRPTQKVSSFSRNRITVTIRR